MTRRLAQSRLRENKIELDHAQRIEYLAYHDGLTGLPNRSMFSKLLDQSISEARRYDRQLAIAFLDLDRFKQINDTLGHDAGDLLLKEVAIRLRRACGTPTRSRAWEETNSSYCCLHWGTASPRQ
jgi:GGDEF domain-containing protein